jgi:hypothetical protein
MVLAQKDCLPILASENDPLIHADLDFVVIFIHFNLLRAAHLASVIFVVVDNQLAPVSGNPLQSPSDASFNDLGVTRGVEAVLASDQQTKYCDGKHYETNLRPAST